MINEIINITQAHFVQVIGNVMMIYFALNEEPKIILPKQIVGFLY